MNVGHCIDFLAWSVPPNTLSTAALDNNHHHHLKPSFPQVNFPTLANASSYGSSRMSIRNFQVQPPFSRHSPRPPPIRCLLPPSGACSKTIAGAAP